MAKARSWGGKTPPFPGAAPPFTRASGGKKGTKKGSGGGAKGGRRRGRGC